MGIKFLQLRENGLKNSFYRRHACSVEYGDYYYMPVFLEPVATAEIKSLIVH